MTHDTHAVSATNVHPPALVWLQWHQAGSSSLITGPAYLLDFAAHCIKVPYTVMHRSAFYFEIANIANSFYWGLILYKTRPMVRVLHLSIRSSNTKQIVNLSGPVLSLRQISSKM